LTHIITVSELIKTIAKLLSGDTIVVVTKLPGDAERYSAAISLAGVEFEIISRQEDILAVIPESALRMCGRKKFLSGLEYELEQATRRNIRVEADPDDVIRPKQKSAPPPLIVRIY